MKNVLLLLLIACSLQSEQVFLRTVPRVINRTEPEYTSEALDARIQGTAILSVLVESDGVPSGNQGR
jgi:outer membrane biosynthesis protein TonB